MGDWVDDVNENRRRRIVGQPASDRVMGMQVAPLTQQQQQSVSGYESGPPVPSYPVFRGQGATGGWDAAPARPDIKAMYGVELNPIIEERRQAAINREVAAGRIKAPTPVMPANAPASSYRGGGYDASAEAKNAHLYEGGFNKGLGALPQYGYGSGNENPWAFRDRVRGGMEPSSYGPTSNKDIFIPQGAGGMPGERIINDYGPGFGGSGGSTRVMATADRNGMFNSFSDVPGARAGGGGGGGGGYNTAAADPYGINADLAGVRQRAAAYRGGSGIMNKIFAASAQRSANKMQALGIQGGQLDLAERRYGPDIAMANTRNWIAQNRGLAEAQNFVAQMGGHHNLLTLPGYNATNVVRPGDVPEGGRSFPMMTPPGQTPQQPQLPTAPAASTRVNMGLTQYDPNNTWLNY